MLAWSSGDADCGGAYVVSEEGFLLIVVGGACVLLVLGILELLWPTKPRRPARRAAHDAQLRSDDFVAPVRLFEPIAVRRPPVAIAPVPPLAPPAPLAPPPPVTPLSLEPPLAPSTPSPQSPEAESPAAELPEAWPLEAEPPEVRALEILPLEPEPLEARLPEPLPPEPQPPEPQPPEAEPPEAELPEVVPLEAEPPEVPAPEILPLEAEPLEARRPETLSPETLLPEPEPLEPSPAVEPPPVVEAPTAEETPPPLEVPTPSRRLRRSKVSPHARPHRVLRARKTHGVETPTPMARERAPAPKTVETASRESFWASAGLPEPVPEARPGRDSPLVETCFAMYQEKRYAEVVMRAEEGLANVSDEPPATLSHETAALWAVLALAKQALGDDEGAGTALASAMEIAPETERPTYRRHFATLTLDAARIRLARARSHEVGDRVETIRAAIAWLERGLAVVPADGGLIDAREAAHEALWSAYERAVARLLQRQEFNGARLLLREALEDPALPPARAEGFRTMFAGTFGGEVGQLTAKAIRSLQEAREPDALESLQRAEDLLATIPAEALPAKRREEVDQRLWWAYTELGKRRVAAGDAEKALGPLRHALGFDSIGPDRQAETRTTLVQALEGVSAARAVLIRRLAEGGQRAAAIARAEDLRALLQSYTELGLTEDELATSTAQTHRLCAELGLVDPA